MDGRTETQVKQYVRQFHSVHLADIIKLFIKHKRPRAAVGYDAAENGIVFIKCQYTVPCSFFPSLSV